MLTWLIVFPCVVGYFYFILFSDASSQKLIDEEPEINSTSISPDLHDHDSKSKLNHKLQTQTSYDSNGPLVPSLDKANQQKWRSKLDQGLSQTRKSIWSRVFDLFHHKDLDQEIIDELEETLYGADLSISIVDDLIENLKSYHHKISDHKDKNALLEKRVKEYLEEIILPVQEKAADLFEADNSQAGPKVIMIVGVNGAGKTTTIGKLATKFQQEGKRVLVGACDTFRAAAVEQLETWAKRAGVDIVKPGQAKTPSAVAYEALQQSIKERHDVCIIDTAGRLHTYQGLMEELKKMKNVLTKLMPQAPHETWLVVDAITGQNALKQAQEFHKTLELSGLIFTKCDGSSKAGSAVSIVKELQVPVRYIGVGENVDDLDDFHPQEYLQAMLVGFDSHEIRT